MKYKTNLNIFHFINSLTCLGNNILNLQFVPVSIENIKKKLKLKGTAQQLIIRVAGFNVCQCPVCKKGTMRKIRINIKVEFSKPIQNKTLAKHIKI